MKGVGARRRARKPLGAERALEHKYSSPLNMSIRINALSELSSALARVLVEAPEPGQRR